MPHLYTLGLSHFNATRRRFVVNLEMSRFLLLAVVTASLRHSPPSTHTPGVQWLVKQTEGNVDVVARALAKGQSGQYISRVRLRRCWPTYQEAWLLRLALRRRARDAPSECCLMCLVDVSLPPAPNLLTLRSFLYSLLLSPLCWCAHPTCPVWHRTCQTELLGHCFYKPPLLPLGQWQLLNQPIHLVFFWGGFTRSHLDGDQLVFRPVRVLSLALSLSRARAVESMLTCACMLTWPSSFFRPADCAKVTNTTDALLMLRTFGDRTDTSFNGQAYPLLWHSYADCLPANDKVSLCLFVFVLCFCFSYKIKL